MLGNHRFLLLGDALSSYTVYDGGKTLVNLANGRGGGAGWSDPLKHQAFAESRGQVKWLVVGAEPGPSTPGLTGETGDDPVAVDHKVSTEIRNMRRPSPTYSRAGRDAMS
jgi:hypothetical protein